MITAGSPEPQLDDERTTDLLGVSPDAPERVVEAAFQEAVKTERPNQGGDAVSVQRLKRSREQLLGN